MENRRAGYRRGHSRRAATGSFKPFKRGSDYMTRRYQGAGLGLSIAKQLVDLMGGSVSYETTVGKGTVFTVILPLEAP